MSIPWNRRTFSKTSPYSQFVTLVVKDEAGRRLTRTMGKTDNLQDLVDFYYSTMAPVVERGSGVFEYRGTQIVFPLQQKPVEFDMKDGDVVDFVPVVKPHTLVTPVLKERYEESRSFACTVRRTDELKGLMSFYRWTARKAGAVFEFDGRRLVGDETPADLQLEDGAIIHVSPA
uniref:Putative ubiquitin-2 like rad60 SUMO-like protein n=1 Tax=Triticum aestivum TaxID=4565 RepID=A0A182BG14_WHEAT|nr:putative ubiquitin-2 like rad60 SUMO-like protein [Triticum aestivum]